MTAQSSATKAYEAAFAAHKQGDLDSAAAGYERSLSIAARNADALHMLGVVRMQQGNADQAVTLIRRSLQVRNDAAAQSNLSSALVTLGRFDEAIEACRAATKLNPKSADAWANFGTALARRSRYPEVLEALDRALQLDAKRPGVHSLRGIALGRLERFDEALESHRRAIALAPDKPQYRNNMSITLKAAGLTGEAEQMLVSAIADGANDPDVIASLGFLMQQRGKVAEAVSAFQQANAEANNKEVGQMLTFLKNYLDTTDVSVQLQQAREGALQLTKDVVRMPPANPDLNRDRPLRVGLVSGDLRDHSVARFLLTVIPAIDQQRIVLYAYSANDPGDASNLAFKAAIGNWRTTSGWKDDEVAKRVRDDKIDILVDLSGPTAGGRLGVFARKPAPIAMTWLGYSGTTGLDAIDYILGDAEVLPDGLMQTVETPWRMPDAYLCFAPQANVPAVAELPALREGYVTFGSFNNSHKLSAATYAAWAAILEAVPNSRVAIKRGHNSSEGIERFTEDIVRRGLSAERVVTLPWVDGWGEHLPLYDQIDIGLDPFPYNGTTTTCESLHMGVPVLTLRGDRFIARVGATLMHNVGLDDWITDSIDQYVARAVEIAADLPVLAELRARLRPQMLASPLCDASRFARNLEAAWRGMWHRYCNTASAER